MENILFEFDVDQLEIKLTNEKLFIKTITSNEAFALRSVNGVGVVDLVDEFNKALTEWKKKSYIIYFLIIFGAIAPIRVFGSLFISYFEPIYVTTSSSTFILQFLSLIVGIVLLIKSKKQKPTIMSAVRIMMNGGNRDFQFDKTGVGNEKVAEFVVKVEATLTSYQKMNN